jgi:hypothetical protein
LCVTKVRNEKRLKKERQDHMSTNKHSDIGKQQVGNALQGKITRYDGVSGMH